MNRRASLLTAVLLATSFGVGSMGCQLIASADRDEIELDHPDAGLDDDAGAGGQGGSGGDGGAGGSGGDGGDGGGGVCEGDAKECSANSDCSSLGSACVIGACEDGCCVQVFTDNGELAPEEAQTPGDCQVLTCDGQGGTKVGWDNDDLPDVSECWIPKCSDGAPASEPKALGEACDGGAKICDGAGNCVAPGCTNGVQDDDETDVDCGGPGCAPCADDAKCLVGSDCESGVCDDTSKTCTAATCDDGVKNGGETGVDCGGSCSVACDGEACTEDGDCQSGYCHSDETCKQPACDDGAQNGGETGVDCGGSDCLACDDDACTEDTECKSGFCNADNECKQPTCNDGVQNGGETGVDCGGSCGVACDGEACAEDGECQSGYCHDPANAGECKQPTCDDGVKNGNEMDVDCVGEEDFIPGGECLLCLWQVGCLSGADCKNGCCDVSGAQCSEPPWCG